MPPRTVKKTVAGPGTKRTTRATRGTPKAKNNPEIAEESVKVEEISAEVKEEVKVEEKALDSTAVDLEPEDEPLSEANGMVSVNQEDEVKESVGEYERGEWLDLEDNEPEGYGGVDYDEKEIEQEDVQEELDEVEEEAEEGDVGEEEGDVGEEEEEEEEEVGEEEVGDMVEEGMEDVREELQGEEERHAVEHHAEMVDAEEEEHHEIVKERRKRKEFEVFVGGLDKDASEDDLRKVFSEVGEVTEVRLLINPQTKKNKGFAFLRFATVEQAKRACTELKNPMVNGKQCGVSQSHDSDTLFLGNICKTWTKEALKQKLKQYGVENIDDMTLVEDSNNEGMNRGFAFLEFSSHSDAMDAFKRLQKRDVMFGVDRTAKVSFADSFIDPGDEIMAQVKTVFVDGLPASWDEDYVRELLKKHGDIEKVELARNMPAAKRKDFGFVTFDSHDAAVTCAKSINNEELGKGENKAKVRARLSRPLQRGKHVARGDFRSGRAVGRVVRAPWGRPAPRGLPPRGARGSGGHLPPVSYRGLKRPVVFRGRRPAMAVPPRGRPLAPLPRSSNRRPPVPSYPKSSLQRDYGRRDEFLPRGSVAADYGSRVVSERRPTYREDYSSRGPGYSDLSRSTSHTAARRTYVDDGYGQRFKRPQSYREGHGRDYGSISGSKRPYTAMDDVHPRYADDVRGRQSRARLDYELGGSTSRYDDAYSDRLGRSNIGYDGRSSISSQDSHGLYSSRHGMGYGGGSFGSGDIGGTYSSSFGSDYMSRGSDVGRSSYSSLYSGRSLGSSSYMENGGSGSYY